MLTEKIIEFQLRRSGPSGRTCTSMTDHFMTKQKSLKKMFEWNIIYC